MKLRLKILRKRDFILLLNLRKTKILRPPVIYDHGVLLNILISIIKCFQDIVLAFCVVSKTRVLV